MALRNQVFIWIGLLLALILFLWVFRGVLLPFVVGVALAYLLNPLVNQLQRWHFPRFWATVVVLLSVLILVMSLFYMLVPLIRDQVFELIQRSPAYFADLQELVATWSPEINAWLGPERAAQVQASLSDIARQFMGFLAQLPAELVSIGLTGASVVGFIVLAPFVAFYLLLDWEGMVRGIDGLLPKQHKGEIKSVLADVNTSMAGVIRGQGGVLLLDAAFYATALSLVGLNYGLAIGLLAGLMSFIPFVGFLVGFVLSVGVALVQFAPNWWMVALVAGIYLFWQVIEGNILYPKFVGSSININPVWMMFALLALGAVFGFVGLLLAVPMAAIASVLIRYGVRKYKESALYLGPTEPGGDVTP
ncbi:AI-2E family transporter [Devosia sediminis]|uniref:AI-2E family transporter n=1 Tax=Devosia sediminis TaxID=2798801 RepID=A0A934MQG4_9HYPH|nr:AI-2E family transporter [Devosia sediminis]MBJ3784339.1 AI-2E family transporter [Devosia sediminis]